MAKTKISFHRVKITGYFQFKDFTTVPQTTKKTAAMPLISLRASFSWLFNLVQWILKVKREGDSQWNITLWKHKVARRTLFEIPMLTRVHSWSVLSIHATHIQSSTGTLSLHDDVIKWKHFPRYWPFMRGTHRSPVNSLHKGQWREALMFYLICARINDWVHNREAGDLRRRRAHYDVRVMHADVWCQESPRYSLEHYRC